MLELKNIVKDYVSGNFITHALKGISVNFRRNEFVSILGASGCGKTTTLNIIGGLDRYTSGDLIINGKSTKNYSDRDWDTYRNHSIGFIFQSYNLIFHQNILKNVELALTISGVSKEERKERALKALEIVGLKGLEKKKPNQLSGGQCQRVAIARALINNPEILLADEPTGALDSETSVQIMELLKEVAKDRLVIMVTHNPDLANKYSTRIITMSDGVLTNDSKPFDGKEEVVKEISKGKKKHSSMNLVTSTGLSLSNLASKIKRTVLVTIAGSIGIIGVASVLAVSRGVKDFIKDMQDDMLSAYPIGIAEESVDYTSLMTGLNASTAREALEFDPTTEAGIDSMINFLITAYSDFTSVKTNTIDRKLVDYINELPKDYAASVHYEYQLDPTNNIFALWNHDFSEDNKSDYVSLNGLTQSYIAELKTVEGFKSYASYVNLFTNFMKEMPGEEDYIMNQYDLIAGSKFATEENEMMLVVDQDTTLTDLLLAEMGYYDHDEFINIAKLVIEKNNLSEEEKTPEKIAELEQLYGYDGDQTISFNELVNKDFYYYPQKVLVKDATQPVANDEDFASITLLKTEDMGGGLQMVTGLYSLEYHDNDRISGTYIGMENESVSYDSVELTRDDITFVPNFQDMKSNVVGSWTGVSMLGNETKVTFNSPSDGVASVVVNGEDPIYFGEIIENDVKVVKGYHYDSFITNPGMISNPANYGGMKMKITGILRLKDDKSFGSLERGVYYSKAFANRYMNDATSEDAILTNAFKEHIKNYKGHEETQTQFQFYAQFDYLNHEKDKETGNSHGTLKPGYASALNGDMSSSFSDLFSSITGINYLETDSVHLRSVCGDKVIVTKDGDAIKDISFDRLPKSISIFPESFKLKDKVTDYLDDWNSEKTLTINGNEYSQSERDNLTYSDTIEVIIAVIDTFINAITIALVVFTSLSLVVSCFMIAVITYISVVERIKEIGIIRSLGGRKGDVASLFIMENLLTGLFSGTFGIAITYVLTIILNTILKIKFGIAIAHLTIPTMIIMIGVSILLSVLSGFIPSQSAAHKDPVVALRSAE